MDHGCDPSIQNKQRKYPRDLAMEMTDSDGEVANNNDNNNTNNSNTNSSDNMIGIIQLLTDCRAESHSLGGKSHTVRAYMQEREAMKAQLINKNGKLGTLSEYDENKPLMVQFHTLKDDAHELPTLQGWLEKKRSKTPHIFQKRWVVVTNMYILWDKTEKYVEQ